MPDYAALAQAGHEEVVAKLCLAMDKASIALRNEGEMNALTYAASEGHSLVVDELLNNEPISDDLIELAIKKGSPNMIKTLLDLQIQKEDEKRKGYS